jgi:hypothetical protein
LSRRGRGGSEHGDERGAREFEFHAHDDITMGSPLSGKELSGLTPALLIAKNSPAAGENRRLDIIVMERTMLRMDCDT